MRAPSNCRNLTVLYQFEIGGISIVRGLGISALGKNIANGSVQNSVSRFASYCRCVASSRLSKGKQKGEHNHKTGNAYLVWAFVERRPQHHPLSQGRAPFLPAQACPTQRRAGDQSVSPQAGVGGTEPLRATCDNVPFDDRRLFG